MPVTLTGGYFFFFGHVTGGYLCLVFTIQDGERANE